MKVGLEKESQPLSKLPFLTAFSKIKGSTKIEKLGTQQDDILFRNSVHFFNILYSGTIG